MSARRVRMFWLTEAVAEAGVVEMLAQAGREAAQRTLTALVYDAELGSVCPGIRSGAPVPEGNAGGAGIADGTLNGGGGGGGGALAAGGSAETGGNWIPGAGGDGKLSLLVTGNANFDTSSLVKVSGGERIRVMSRISGWPGGGGAFIYGQPQNGAANTGGGGAGGGGRGPAAFNKGGNGGSGIVILKYQYRN